jgi:hypothetical protein
VAVALMQAVNPVGQQFGRPQPIKRALVFAHAVSLRFPLKTGLLAFVIAFGANHTPPASAAIPAPEREALIAIYNQTNGGAWGINTNWCTSTPCPAESPIFSAPGTECFDQAQTGTGWYGVECDDQKAHVVLVNLSANHLAGSLPSIAALTHLQALAIDRNRLSGPLPELSGFTALQIFLADDNNFSGPIPDLQGLTALEDVSISDNRLSGPLPGLAGLSALQVFRAEANELTGEIPSLSGLTHLIGIDLSRNQLTGPIPDLSGLVSLEWFFAFGNRLTGSIPNLPSTLSQFRLGNNALSGAVPAAPANLLPGFSSLCPNPLDLSPSDNDAGWNAATGHTPWWTVPTPDNRCDDLLNSGFEPL